MAMTSLVSVPWASDADIPAGTTTPAGGWAGPLTEASDVLFELSGRQFRGAGQSRVQIRPSGITEIPLLPGYVPTPVPLVPVGGGWFPQQWGLEVVRLPSSPVTSVDEVVIDDTVVDPDRYECDVAGLLRRTDCRPWPCDGSLFATFTHGQDPPLGGRRSAVSLAVELVKARTGDGSCRLRNIQTITREGVTMAAVNLRESLAVGLTGLYEVDLWLKSVNPNAMRRRGGAWTPDWGRARRLPRLPGPAPSYVPTLDLDVYAGDDRSFTFPVLDSAGNPFPMTGWGARAQVRTAPGGALLHEWSTSGGNATVSDGTVVLDVADSEGWTFRGGVYDLQLIDPDGHHDVIAHGKVRVTAGVTT